MGNTAIFLFIRDPKEEAKNKHFAGEGRLGQSQNIAQALNQHALNLIKKTDLPYYILTSKDQQGNDFSEKFTNAFLEIFNKGYDKVIALGNDHPELSSAKIQAGADYLRDYDQVVGPAKDGGLYLIGMHFHSFAIHQFRNLPWQTGRLYDAFSQLAASNQNSCKVLEPLKDADNYWQLQAILTHLRARLNYQQLYQLITSILASIEVRLIEFTQKHNYQYAPLPFDLRGPPIEHS